MRSLWRRFVAWLNVPDETVIEYIPISHVAADDFGVGYVLRFPSAAACEHQIAILREIGASPRSIQIAEEVLAEVRAREGNA